MQLAQRKAALHTALFSGTIIERQIATEIDAAHAGVAHYRSMAKEALDRGEGHSLKPAERLIVHWLPAMVVSIKSERRKTIRFLKENAGFKGVGFTKQVPRLLKTRERTKRKNIGRTIYGPVLLSLDPHRLAYITIAEALTACMNSPGGANRTTLCYAVGRAVFAEVSTDMLKREKTEYLGKDGKVHQTNLAAQMARKLKNINPKRVNWWANQNVNNPIYERRAAIQVGVALLQMLFQCASTAGYNEPFELAFLWKTIRVGNRKSKRLFIPSDKLLDIIEEGHEVRQWLRPRYTAMLLPPYPWVKALNEETGQVEIIEGGYARIRTPLMSKPTRAQKKALYDNWPVQLVDGINAISANGLRMNKSVVDIARVLWEKGGGVCDLAHRDTKAFPPKPHDIDTNEEALAKWKRDASDVHRENIARKGQRKQTSMVFRLAELYSREEAVWMPHQIDFRGRCYPVPLYLHFQGPDLCRAMFESPRAKAPGARGEHWIRIHAANSWGKPIDKLTFAQRLAWVREHESDIERVARDPLAHEWWMRAKKPFQFLAACFALTNKDAASRLIVKRDGTFNAMQHYAAMGRDEDGAAASNLLESDTRADAYGLVAREVQALVAADPVIPHLADMIDDDVVKTNVMTKFYGVTMVGAKKQVRDKLAKRGLEGDALHEASKRIAGKTIKAVGNVCIAATKLMEWIQECCDVQTAKGDAFNFITPAGLHVILDQARNYQRHSVKTIVGEMKLIADTGEGEMAAPVDRTRQRNGSAPDVVHGVDSSHLYMVAPECRRRDMILHPVHDAYGTHAADMDQLGEILADTFVGLHREPYPEALYRQWIQRGYAVPRPPEPGNLDIEKCRGQYAFS